MRSIWWERRLLNQLIRSRETTWKRGQMLKMGQEKESVSQVDGRWKVFKREDDNKEYSLSPSAT